jgi:hypothetical protein
MWRKRRKRKEGEGRAAEEGASLVCPAACWEGGRRVRCECHIRLSTYSLYITKKYIFENVKWRTERIRFQRRKMCNEKVIYDRAKSL